jgi:hypothetical protein
VTIATKYDRKSPFPMLLKCYHHLHPLPKTKSSFVNKFDEDNNLDIFEMVATISELAKELVN